ncbi:hypothetical protein B9K06_22120 [Bacillus sp. OG2]|nr:hypothetical protein B9K06_22120 [Bacillus sp. OG2]
MKRLKVFKENGEFVVERVNEFNHSTKRFFITEEGLKEGLDAYLPVLREYQIEISEDLQPLVKSHLNINQ